MKKFSLALSLSLLLLLIAVSCAQNATETEQVVDMVHIGNFDVGTTNKLIYAASARGIKYSLSAPYGEGCTDPADCLWDDGDTAFHIEKGREAELWQSWDELFCQEGSAELMCPLEDS